jgi:RNA polymerase sigma factor (sigma-70 family)
MRHEALDEHRRFLWGLCYRMTGSAADADDLVQETFVRALQCPPRRRDLPWRPWLVRVAMNLSRDELRRRKRAAYVGPWLPAPIETGDEASVPSHEPSTSDGSPVARYDLLESVSFAFLVALETLTPRQRAVLLLRDVFDYSVRETAEALDMSQPNVKTTLHRSRVAMRAYDRHRQLPTRSLQERTGRTLERFLQYLVLHDMRGLQALLADDVRAVTDGGGEFLAALRPIEGRDRVIRLFAKVRARYRAVSRGVRMLNGLPAVVVSVRVPPMRERMAPRYMLRCDIGLDDRIICVHVVSARRKMSAIA